MTTGKAMNVINSLSEAYGPHRHLYEKPHDKREDLLEGRYVARKVTVGFPKDVPGNYTDAHKPITPFGSAWGRGVIFQDDDGKHEFMAVVAGPESSHAQIKTRVGQPLVKTFYFGFADDTLYLEHASVAANKDFTRAMLIEIAGALTSKGPLRGILFKMK
ncbi:MAG: hypothetical protein LC687_00730 [Actinobacteria bacterium]|nr:hypothetical protein [Actinomycetota bacterium]